LLCVVPRFPFRITRGRSPWPIGAVWRDETLAFPALRGKYQNVFTGALLAANGSLELAQIFADFPVAVLVRRSNGQE
jgi:maltooligosyltrehalose synthase